MSSRVLRDQDAKEAKPFEWFSRQTAERPAPLYRTVPPERPTPGPCASEGEDAVRAAEEAYARGLRDGESEYARRSGAQLEAARRELAAAVRDLAAYRPRLRREAEHDLVRLALTVARRLIRRELSVDPEALQGVVRAALERISSREKCLLRIHPAHAASIRGMVGESVEVVADSTLEPGAVLFETAGGILDAGIETQLGEIERGLTDLLP